MLVAAFAALGSTDPYADAATYTAARQAAQDAATALQALQDAIGGGADLPALHAAYEGMLVRITTPMTAAQNYFQGRYGQVTLSAEGRMIKPTLVMLCSTLPGMEPI